MRRRSRLLVASAVTIAAMTMVLIGTFEASVPFVAPGDLAAEHEGRRVQVEGIVQTMTVTPDQLQLVLSDGGDATTQVRYAYAGQRPITLEEGRLVVAKGVYNEGVVEANQISVRAHETPEMPSS